MKNKRITWKVCGVFVFAVVIGFTMASCDDSPEPRPTNPAISLERAIEIAQADLVSRSINAIFRTDSGMSWERRQWVWELEFSPVGQGGVIEYYINVHTGAIVKYEWDR